MQHRIPLTLQASLSFLAGAFTLLLAGSAGAQTLATTPGGVGVDVADVRAAVAHVPAPNRQQALSRPQAWTAHAQELLARRLLAGQAEAAALDRDPVVQARLRLARERVLADVRLEKLEADLYGDPAAIEAYAQSVYRANPERFRASDRVRARHILLRDGPDARERAQRLIDQIRGGAAFEPLARDHSVDVASRDRGGDLGFFDPQQMVPPFRDAVLAMTQPGELAGPVQSQFGWHIIRFEERRAAGIAPFEEVKALLIEDSRARLSQERRQALLAELMRDARFDDAAAQAAAAAAQAAAEIERRPSTR